MRDRIKKLSPLFWVDSIRRRIFYDNRVIGSRDLVFVKPDLTQAKVVGEDADSDEEEEKGRQIGNTILKLGSFTQVAQHKVRHFLVSLFGGCQSPLSSFTPYYHLPDAAPSSTRPDRHHFDIYLLLTSARK